MKWGLHVHHDVVCEPLTAPIEERIVDIEVNKLPAEIPTRLKALRELTDEEVARLPESYRQAGEVYGQAGLVYHQAWEAYHQAWKAYSQVGEVCAVELATWHKSVCQPNCPWNGKTLFPSSENQ
ncbi:MAG: hypothetical protein Q8P12_02665 [bacterium]|nr:hypothetical protein [bacterium]